MSRILIIILSLFFVGIPAAIADTDIDALYKKYKNIESSTLLSMGRKCINDNHTDDAIAIFTILAKRHESSKHPDEIKLAIEARQSLGVLNFNKANYVASYSSFLSAAELEGTSDSPGRLNLASIYLYFGDRRRAYRCLKDVFDAALATGNNYMASNALLNILDIDIDSTIINRDSIAKIIDTFHRRVLRTPDNNIWAFTNDMATAKRYSLNGDPIATIKQLRKVNPEASSVMMPERQNYTIYIALGRNFIKTGQLDSAEHYIRRAMDLASEYQYPELLISGYKDLSYLYLATGRTQLADKFRYLQLQLQDSIFNARELGYIHDIELMHENDKFERHINVLRMEEKMKMRILLIVSIALLILLALIVVLLRQNKNLQSKNKSLFEKNLAIMNASEIMTTNSHSREKYETTPISDETRNNIIEKIKEVMSDESVFCREGFSLNDLAALCGSNTKYVSRVLNEDFAKSFTLMLNERRIIVAKKRFLDIENYGHLTIEAIVRDLGFKSRSTFSKTFKKLTGLNPSEFQRLSSDKKYTDTHDKAQLDPDEPGA
ncbi:MAG: helix-turn-helix domain-containing protein [Muribaculaceae bacterium]|nr:helix-turn-helix domain-containing protein [Muribaculaceae bacterium]